MRFLIFKRGKKTRITGVVVVLLLYYMTSNFLPVGLYLSDLTTARHELYKRGDFAVVPTDPPIQRDRSVVMDEINIWEWKKKIRSCHLVPPVRCEDLHRVDNGSSIQNATLYRHRYVKLAGCGLADFTINCPTFKDIFGYTRTAISKKEQNFPIAFSIRMHKDPEQVEMLLRAIYAPQNIYCIYIDKHSPVQVHSAMESLSRCFDNVFIATNLEPMYYATSSQMRADLQCMKELLTKNFTWEYYLNLAGQEFPLKTNREIVDILELLGGTNDIEVVEYVAGWQWRYRNHVVPHGRNWFLLDGPKTDPLGLNLTLFKGSAYGAFSRPFVQFILEDPRAKRLVQWLNDTFAPEETLFATLNSLSDAPGGYRVYVDQAAPVAEHISRVVLWKWTESPVCRGMYQRNVCILSSGDLNWLIQRKQLFANKFDINYDHTVLYCLLQAIQHRKQNPSEIDYEYYRKLPHVKHRT